MESITQEDYNSYIKSHVSSRYICSLSRINLGAIMREFYPFTRVQVSSITMRANIFRFLMARTYGSHGSHVWLACMARTFGSLGSHGSHVWLAWLAYWQLSYTSIPLHIPLYSFIHFHIPSYAIIHPHHLHTPIYSFIRLHIPLYTSYTFISRHTPSYSFIYFHSPSTPSYTFIYFHIPS